MTGLGDGFLDYLTQIEELRKHGDTFALATVVKVFGSASARVGSKAIFDDTGVNIFGWVGGGCAERFIGEQAVESLSEGRGRLVLADLDDEVFGLGVACGGKMEVFIDPIAPLEKVKLPDCGPLQAAATDLAHRCGLELVKEDGQPRTLEEVFLALARNLAAQRGMTGRSLREERSLPFTFGATRIERRKSVKVIGHGRVIEALNHFFTTLGWEVGSDDARAGDFVIVAGHSARDPEYVARALNNGAAYVGMVGSRKRAFEVAAHLKIAEGATSDLPLFVPVGLDLDARNPGEIALSIVAEILQQDL